MVVKPFPSYTTKDQPGGSTALDYLILILADIFNSLRNAVTNETIVLAQLDTAAVKVYHGLPSQPTSIDVVGLNAGQVVYEAATINKNRAKYVLMQATGPVTARLRFS